MTRRKISDPLTVAENFRAAVEYVADRAKEYLKLEESMVAHGVAFEGFADMLLWERLNCEILQWGDGSIIRVSNAASAELFELQAHDGPARRLFALIVSSKLLFAEKLTDDEARFAGYFLAGKLPPISRKRGHKSGREFELRRFVYILAHAARQKFDLILTRGDENDQKLSACDAVSVGLALAGRKGTSYSAVKQIALSKALGKKVEEIRLARFEGTG